jgi:hypothetical protein
MAAFNHSSQNEHWDDTRFMVRLRYSPGPYPDCDVTGSTSRATSEGTSSPFVTDPPGPRSSYGDHWIIAGRSAARSGQYSWLGRHVIGVARRTLEWSPLPALAAEVAPGSIRRSLHRPVMVRRGIGIRYWIGAPCDRKCPRATSGVANAYRRRLHPRCPVRRLELDAAHDAAREAVLWHRYRAARDRGQPCPVR